MNVSGISVVGRLMRRVDPFPDRQRSLYHLAKLGIDVKPRTTGATGQIIRFADNSTAEISTVIWSIGYQDETAWLDIPFAKDEQSGIIQEKGKSPMQGVFFLGKPWQRNRSSALIMGAGDDAAIIVKEALKITNAWT